MVLMVSFDLQQTQIHTGENEQNNSAGDLGERGQVEGKGEEEHDGGCQQSRLNRCLCSGVDS